MYVACSTLCFGKQSLGEALKTIGEMGFTRADVAFCESGPHLKPSEVCADPSRVIVFICQTLLHYDRRPLGSFRNPRPEIASAEIQKQLEREALRSVDAAGEVR